MSYLYELREWTMWLMEAGILYYVAREFYYDKNKDDVKKQKRTRTTKKVTNLPTGEVVTEESMESVEGKG